MALRSLAGKLRVSTTAALQKASSPRVSSAARSRLLTSRSSQNGEAMGTVNGARDVRYRLKDLAKLVRKEISDFEKASIALDNLPKLCALASALGVFLATGTWAYVFGAFDGSRRKYSA